jgi:hypothetical protein
VAGCCVVGNEISVSIKFKEILDCLTAICFSRINMLDFFPLPSIYCNLSEDIQELC